MRNFFSNAGSSTSSKKVNWRLIIRLFILLVIVVRMAFIYSGWMSSNEKPISQWQNFESAGNVSTRFCINKPNQALGTASPIVATCH